MLRMPFASQHVSIGRRENQGFLDCPDDARALVLFVHEQGCGRHNPEDNQIATTLHKFGFATLLVDLFDPKEQFELSASVRDAQLPTRIAEVIDWMHSAPPLKGLELHCVGSGDIADPLLRAVHASSAPITRVALFSSPTEPDAELIGRPPPTLILGNTASSVFDKRAADAAPSIVSRAPLDSAGKVRLQAAGRRIAEWLGNSGRASTFRDCLPPAPGQSR